jgi:lipoprotein-anchoring transpeptidase ErfK/SrfK
MAKAWRFLILILVLCSASFVEAQRTSRRPNKPVARRPAASLAPKLQCGNVAGFQTLLDRHGFSPGEIDGRLGANFAHTLGAFQQAHRLQQTGRPDCDTWRALGGDTADSVTASYTITEADMNGPFTENIPADLTKQAALPALDYHSPLEKLAERFHTAPALLQRMNRGRRFAVGGKIDVPGVIPFDPDAKPSLDPSAADITLTVSRKESSVRATDTNGTLVFFAPITSGSVHDPLPVGDWQVTAVNWHPVFHYNPDLFWDAKATQSKADLKPGPNNPVGIVWIGLNLEHYGLHGTPEPGHIGHTESHGCVRLTNWDAVRLAALVKHGTPVLFR